MSKQKLQIIKLIISFLLVILILICAPILILKDKPKAKADSNMVALTLWQIDSFEGGKGSRASYLQKIGNGFSKTEKCYINVISLTADAARENLRLGNIPDLISYGAGMYGMESYITGNYIFKTWCRGSYCVLTLAENADFNDLDEKNTVINGGTDNLVDVAITFSGLGNATIKKATGAYVSLINGEYKYLFGTQRDIFRLRTRGVGYSFRPVEEFNDLYQNISVTSDSKEKVVYAEKYIDYLIDNNKNVTELGLFFDGKELYDDELHQFENINYQNKLVTPVSETTLKEIKNAAINNDLNLLKNLLK